MTDSTPVFLPYRSEFGHMVMHHAPFVKACHNPRKRVICEPGYEALYPCELPHIHCDIRPDQNRREWASYDYEYLRYLEETVRESKDIPASADFIYPLPRHPENLDGLELFAPKPFAQVDLDSDIDVVICPRKRKFGRDKNWEHWGSVFDEIADRGLHLFAAGKHDASDVDSWRNRPCPRTSDRPGYYRAWDYDRPLDATIAAMNKAKLVLSTDNGLAHLAMLIGKPLVMIVCADDGVDRVAPRNQKVKTKRFARNNHKNVPIIHINAWNHPHIVADKVQVVMEMTNVV